MKEVGYISRHSTFQGTHQWKVSSYLEIFFEYYKSIAIFEMFKEIKNLNVVPLLRLKPFAFRGVS